MSVTTSFRGLNLFSKLNFRCTSLQNYRSKIILRHIGYKSQYKAVLFNSRSVNCMVVNYKCLSNEATIAKHVETLDEKPTFQELMSIRKRQAKNSVLIGLHNKEDISSATAACEEFGEIKNLFSYNGESENVNVFLLVEFTDESSIEKFLSACQNEQIKDTFTISSRILYYKKKFPHDLPKFSLNVKTDVSAFAKRSKPTVVSELIEDLYVSEKLSDLSIRLRFFFCRLIKDSVSGLFPHCDVIPFGSSVNGVGKQGCDLDIVIRFYPSPSQEYQLTEFSFMNKECKGDLHDLQRRSVHAFAEYLKTFLPGFSSIKEVLKARVPILKLKHSVLGLECDISFNQISAVLMSEMLYFCGEVDNRIRPLLFAVKKWAKETDVTYNYPGSWITNFGLSLLVIFFLQNRPIPLLPCLNDAVKIVGSEASPNFKIDYLMSLPDLQAKAALNEETLAELLLEFLTFLGTNPFTNQHISILTGVATATENKCPIWVQYPLQEDKNVTKNVCKSELDDLCAKARLSCEYLSKSLQQKEIHSKATLTTILGTPYISKTFANKSKKLDYAALLQQQASKRSNKGYAMKKQFR